MRAFAPAARPGATRASLLFNVHDGKDILDPSGTELADWHTARQYAVKYAGKLLDDEAERVALGEDWCMEVCDEHGLILFQLDFHVSLAPVLLAKSSASPP